MHAAPPLVILQVNELETNTLDARPSQRVDAVVRDGYLSHHVCPLRHIINSIAAYKVFSRTCSGCFLVLSASNSVTRPFTLIRRYAEVYATLSSWPGVEPVLQNMPDPVRARESRWVPFMKKQLRVGADTVVIGHSSGAVAAMRLCEDTQIRGLVLVSACHTDLGIESERQAGYYSRPWEWDKIKANAGWILQYHSDNDPFIPVDEARHVAQHLESEYASHTLHAC